MNDREITSVADDATRANTAGLTAEIVSAYVAHNKIGAADVAPLIAAVAGQLNRVGAEPEPVAEEKPVPAVPIRSSVRPDHLVCLACGKPQKILKRHLAVQHGLTPAQYRERFGLKRDYPMAAPNYTQQRRELAVAIGLGRPKKSPRRRKAGGRARAAASSEPAAVEA